MRQETLDSATSYGVGGLGFLTAHLMDAAQTAQAVAIILSCVVVAIRLVHDGMKLYRYWRGDGKP